MGGRTDHLRHAGRAEATASTGSVVSAGDELVLACEPGDRSRAPCKSQTEVAVSGNMGWEAGYLKVIVKGAVVDTGKWLSVMRKQDGNWQLFRDTALLRDAADDLETAGEEIQDAKKKVDIVAGTHPA
jgi:hypothetical protein